MANRDVFALDRTGFNGFLFAAIGTEDDGSRLTVLSALARLGEDPWATAARWARMPKAASGMALAATIEQMPVTPEDRLAATDTAARLVQLLSLPDEPASHGIGSTQPRSLRTLMTAVTMLAVLAMLAASAVMVAKQSTQAAGGLSGPVSTTAP